MFLELAGVERPSKPSIPQVLMSRIPKQEFYMHGFQDLHGADIISRVFLSEELPDDSDQSSIASKV